MNDILNRETSKQIFFYFVRIKHFFRFTYTIYIDATHRILLSHTVHYKHILNRNLDTENRVCVHCGR